MLSAAEDYHQTRFVKSQKAPWSKDSLQQIVNYQIAEMLHDPHHQSENSDEFEKIGQNNIIEEEKVNPRMNDF